MKIYGPYTRPDGRKHICIMHDDGKRQTKSYPRYLIEQHLGRELSCDETVDHINNDYTDDRLENLQILTRKENSKKEMVREHRQRKYVTFECPVCGSEATKPENQIKHNRNMGKAGPFCSRSCAGKGTHVNHWQT